MKNRIKLLIILVIGSWFIVHSFKTSCYGQEGSRYIRVSIIQDTGTLRLKVNGRYQVIDLTNNRTVEKGYGINTTVTLYKGGILLGRSASGARKLLVKADDSGVVIINGRLFKGDILLIKNDSLHLSVINRIDLEEYVKGILYHEASHYWPDEALKVQAIVSRTYAVYQMRENAAKDFDVTSDIYSQVYGGKTSERYRTNKAVTDTTGSILTYKDKVFPAYFHATCAGHTEDASMLWSINLEPLKGVACPFCKESPHFNWHYVLSLKDLEDKLSESGYRTGRIKDMIILGKDKSGRVTALKISSEKKETKVPAKDFRNIIGPNLIRSTKFSVSVSGSEAVFEGTGWGHGVGLCQWGAYFMAKDGKTADQILKYYYPGSNISSIAK